MIPTRLRPPPPEVAPAEWEPLALVDSPLELSYLIRSDLHSKLFFPLLDFTTTVQIELSIASESPSFMLI